MRTILSLFIALPSIAFALAGVGCGNDDVSGSGAEVTVTASTTQLADLARNVAGDRAEIDGLLAANSDPHDYEPLPSDAEALLESDLILKSGGDLDIWLDQLVESSGSEAPELVLLDRVGTIDGEPDHEEEITDSGPAAEEEDAEGEESNDPHWWQDPRNAITAVEAIRDELTAVDPGGRQAYEENAAEYIEQLEQLDREVAECIDQVPEGERRLVTSHDALGYYADRYGIEVVGAVIPALTTQAQASAGETAQLVDLIRETGVSTVFPEAGVSGELEAAIASEADATVGGELWADTLGPDDSDGATYIAAIQSNTARLVEGFTGGQETCSIDVE